MEILKNFVDERSHQAESFKWNVTCKTCANIISYYVKGRYDSYPLFVHVIRENINGLGSFRMRL